VKEKSMSSCKKVDIKENCTIKTETIFITEWWKNKIWRPRLKQQGTIFLRAKQT
jgi:hypothetical protein